MGSCRAYIYTIILCPGGVERHVRSRVVTPALFISLFVLTVAMCAVSAISATVVVTARRSRDGLRAMTTPLIEALIS